MLTKIARILLWTYILLTFEIKLHLLTWTCKVVSLFGIRPYVFAIHQELTKSFCEKSFKSNFNWCFVLAFNLNYLLLLNQYFIFEEWFEIIYFCGMKLGYFCEFLWRQHCNFFLLIFHLECWLLYFCFKAKKFFLYFI